MHLKKIIMLAKDYANSENVTVIIVKLCQNRYDWIIQNQYNDDYKGVMKIDPSGTVTQI